MAGNGGVDVGLKCFKKVPVYVVEEHNDALQFIYSAIGGKKLPLEGTTMVHLDSHPDLLVSNRLRGEVARDGWSVLPELDIENWILPAAAAGHLARVVWLRPPWATQLADGTRTFRIGEHPDTGFVRVDSREPYFLADALYSSRLREERVVTLSVEELGDPDRRRGDLAEAERVARTVDRLNISQPYVLDVDLDFFSTDNPFLTTFPQSTLYERLQPLYEFDDPPTADPEDMERSMRIREQQLKELEELFQFLSQHGSLNKWEGKKDERFFKVLELAQQLTRESGEPVDWRLVHAAGCTLDHGGLPVHVSTPAQIASLVERSFVPLLRALPLPVLVTVARSSNDEYCPVSQVDMIQDLVLSALKRELGTDEPRLYYLEQMDID